MGLIMRTWHIAKKLLEICDSPNDVKQVIQLLNTATSIRDICSKLQQFSSHEFTVRTDNSDQEDEYGYLQISEKAVGAPVSVEVTSEIAQAYQLETLLRASGKTNKQIETWVTENFDITHRIGKGSLRLYLARVLNYADLSLRNRMLGAAYGLVSKDSNTNSDILQFWDALDKRFTIRD